MGVTEVDVRQTGPAVFPAEELKELELRFSGHDEDELMTELKELVRARLTP
jgi:hypothetical protein